MKKAFRWIIQSLFAPVSARRGAFAGSLGFLLGLMPLYGERIPILFALSILFRLNIVAISIGMIIPVFIPFFKSVAFLLSHLFEGYAMSSASIKFWLSGKPNHSQTLPIYNFLGRLVIGGVGGILLFPLFFWFYNFGIRNEDLNKEFIFLDPSRNRWKIIKRMGIGLLAFSLLISFSFMQSIYINPEFPKLHLNGSQISGISPISEKLSEKSLVKQLKDEERLSSFPQIDYKKHSHPKKSDQTGDQEVYGFYVNWDENSMVSLKRNINSMTTVIPEWLQLMPNLSFKSSIDPTVVALAKVHNVKIMPLINNFINNKWDPDALHKLFSNPAAENLFIGKLTDFVKKNGFSGINIDFENINTQDQEQLTQFISNLSSRFHQNALLVSQDVPPDNQDFDYEALSKSVDRMIVMMYDEHSSDGEPGPIASADWVKNGIENLDIPSEKLIVSLGNFGYDWTENSKAPADPVTFGDIMNMSFGTKLNIQWNSQTGNPYLRYKEGEDQHIIWFLDAATFYNEMQTAIDNGSKGVALWRLGSEDPAIWKIINHTKEGKSPAPALEGLTSPTPVHYTGQGEILNIVSSAQDGKRIIQTDQNGLISNENYKIFPKPYEVVRYGKPKFKEVVLTFDDGPDPKYTPEILDILDKYHIKGSFFIVGENAELHPELIERLYKEGHEIGNHTFTHPNVASISPLHTKMELNANQRLFQEITGHSMTMFRAPYVADAEPSTPNELLPILRAQEMGYTMIGELIDPEDWQRPSSEEILKRVLNQLPNGNVILLHDAGGDRTNTVEALPKIIEALQKRGYTFTTIGNLIGKSNQEMMPPALKDSPYLVYDKAIFGAMYGWRHGIIIIFYSAIVLGIIRLAFLVFLSRRQAKKYKDIPADFNNTPFVHVVIAAYNEETVICKTVDSILNSDYPAFKIMVVDDGSKDNTAKVVEETYKDNERVQLIRKVNGGKASAVNVGIKESNGEFIVALDADTIIASNAISLLMRHFRNENVAAVSGNVKVGNIGNLLTSWQHIEYVTGFNLERRAFAELNCITVVPGAIGAWRKTAIEQAGYFKEDTLAEDTDITLTLLKMGHKIEFEEKAYAYTEAPEDIKGLAKQRYRWTYGTLQCLWKHKDALFDKKNKTLGFIGLPNMWIYQYFYQSFSPIADLLFVIALFGNYSKKAVIGFILFYLVDLCASLYAFRLEKENPRSLFSLFLQRILYKQIMTYVVIKSILSAIRGVTVGWNKLKRSGNVDENTFN